MDSTDGVRGSGFDWMDPAFGLLPAYYMQGDEAEAGVSNPNASVEHFFQDGPSISYPLPVQELGTADVLNGGQYYARLPNAYIPTVSNVGSVAWYNYPAAPHIPEATTSGHLHSTDTLNNGYFHPQQPNAYVPAASNIGFVNESAQYNNLVEPCFPEVTASGHLNLTETLNNNHLQTRQRNAYATAPSQFELIDAPTGYNVYPSTANSGNFSSYQPSAIPAPAVNAIVPPAPPAPPIPGNPTQPGGVPCTHLTCPKVFTRAGDMRRHAKKHNPLAERFFCAVVGCKFETRGFGRRDKLADHVRAKHGE